MITYKMELCADFLANFIEITNNPHQLYIVETGLDLSLQCIIHRDIQSNPIAIITAESIANSGYLWH